MPHENLAAPRFEGTQVDGRRVVDSSRPGECGGIAIEVEVEGINVLSYLLVHKVFYVLPRQFHVGKTRYIAAARSAEVVPTRPLRLSSWDVGVSIEHFALGVGRRCHQTLDRSHLSCIQTIRAAAPGSARNHFRLPLAGGWIGNEPFFDAGLSASVLKHGFVHGLSSLSVKHRAPVSVVDSLRKPSRGARVTSGVIVDGRAGH